MSSCISILGSTGSIGRQTLDVADQLHLRVAALTANRDVDRLEAQCRKYHPRLAAMMDERAYQELKARLSDMNITVVLGLEGLVTAASLPEADTVVTAVSGMVGLKPTLAAIREKKRIALANKETLVCAGELVMEQAKKYGAEIIPVDSEHSAIFQCLMGNHDKSQIRRLLLTCSGGPFYGMDRAQLSGMKKEDALRHPNWKMGPKITIDCATLMNKGLEVIEAHHLFQVPIDDIRVLVHRQSKIHSMVEFVDGVVKAQLGGSDMRAPIQYALSYPERWEASVRRVDWCGEPDFTFDEADERTFGCLALAKRAGREHGTLPCAMNAANEVANEAFRRGLCGFLDIERSVGAVMDAWDNEEVQSVEQLLEVDRRAREMARAQLGVAL